MTLHPHTSCHAWTFCLRESPIAVEDLSSPHRQPLPEQQCTCAGFTARNAHHRHPIVLITFQKWNKETVMNQCCLKTWVHAPTEAHTSSSMFRTASKLYQLQQNGTYLINPMEDFGNWTFTFSATSIICLSAQVLGRFEQLQLHVRVFPGVFPARQAHVPGSSPGELFNFEAEPDCLTTPE